MMNIWVNGSLRPADQAAVSAADMSLLHGSGLFTTARVYHGRVFRLEQHLSRMAASAKALGLNFTPTAEQLASAVTAAVADAELADARLRLTVTAGDSPLIRPPAEDQFPTSAVVVTVSPLMGYAPELYEKGAGVVVSNVRYNATDPLCGHKTTSYLANLCALQEARAKGALEALRFTSEGLLAEGAISNVWIVRGERLITPPADLPVLPGIARGVVLEVAERVGLTVEERHIQLAEVLEADEVLLTNSIMEVLPVVRVERRAIGDEQVGAAARSLRQAYRDVVDEELGFGEDEDGDDADPFNPFARPDGASN